VLVGVCRERALWLQLIDARTSEVVWAGDHEIKRQGLEDVVYR